MGIQTLEFRSLFPQPILWNRKDMISEDCAADALANSPVYLNPAVL